MLSEALPLVSHLHQTYTDLNASLSDVQNDVDSLDISFTENTEHIKMNQHTLKVSSFFTFFNLINRAVNEYPNIRYSFVLKYSVKEG